MKKFLQEFKAFALKGNVMSMAVGVIIGGAFQSIVTSLTTNFINPLIALLTGGVKKDENGNPMIIGGSFTINGVDFNYGAFLSAVINFLIMALILFLLIKGMNKLMELGHKKQEEAPAAPPEPSKEEILLSEIRDLLKAQNSAKVTEEKTE
ncbi:MAG: large conductance mechanosensitive channel protein MscL [Ruminococcaceae bacterium]|nr:large conductance mechanosensitive channel protein MscL [Oscillospiraceae bacterium]